jgi:hypothetical protein
MLRITKPFIAAAIPIVAAALIPRAATAAETQVSFTGNYLVKAALPPEFGNTACLKLVDNGSAGSQHSGPVTSTGDLGGLSGEFQIVNNILVVNLQAGSDTGEVVFVQFIAPASDGAFGNGVYNHGGFFPTASFAATFSKKGGC